MGAYGAGAPQAGAGGPPLFNPALTGATLSPDEAQWCSVTNEPERPDNPPAFVTDEGAWQDAKAQVHKNWGQYEDPWAVVTHVYKNMTGES